jgi:cell division protease FtsH
LLGGRAAEEVVFGDVSTGAENDLDRATAMARRMVCIYGMSPSVGLVHIGHRQHPFLSGGMDGELQRDFSEHTARDVDAEVKKLLDDAYHQAKQILTDHRDQLESVSQELLEHENIDRQTFNRLIGRSAAANGEAPPAPETPSPLPTPPAE